MRTTSITLSTKRYLPVIVRRYDLNRGIKPMRRLIEGIAYIANLLALLFTTFAFLGIFTLFVGGGASVGDCAFLLVLAVVPHCLVTCLYRLIPEYSLPPVQPVSK
jgi:fatty acid desaturase